MDPLAIAALFSTMLLISAVPGPVDFAVIGRSISHGFIAAMWFVAGVLVAEVFLVGAAVYGLSALIENYGSIYRVVIWASALLLIFMGVQGWRSAAASANPSPVSSNKSSRVGSSLTGIATGFLMTAGDPKAIIFYMALLPAFVDLGSVDAPVFFTVLITALCAVLLVKAAYAMAAVRAMDLLAARGIQRGFQRAAAAVLIATGLFLIARELMPGK